VRSPLGALAGGLVAGAAGTAAMTAYQDLVAKRRHQEQSAPKRWKDAPAPAQVGRRMLEGVLGRHVTLEQAPKLGRIMHWAYGTSWGGLYGLVAGTVRTPALPAGGAFGTAVWAASYAELVPLGIYEPPWKYPVKELALDLSYHLVFGVATAAAFERL
jgi:hypothetical protein